MAKSDEKSFTKRELMKRAGNISQIASIRHYQLIDGKADGVKAFSVHNGGGLDFTVLESKCLDIFDLHYKGINLNYISKPGLVAPGLADVRGIEFLRSIAGGMMYTCGLNNVGSDCTDGDIYNCFHGRIRNIPAEKVGTSSRWEGEDYVLSVSGEMREASLFKDNLVLRRKIVTKMGSKAILIHNEVENEGHEEQGLMIMFHINAGYPLLDEGARFIAPSMGINPKDEVAARGLSEWTRMTGPIDQFPEQVFIHRTACDMEGNTEAALINDKLQLGLYVKYNGFQLPTLNEWKSMGSGDYAFGIEPANCSLDGRVKEIERATLPKIKPFETKIFDLEIGILEGIAAINRFEKEVGILVANQTK